MSNYSIKKEKVKVREQKREKLDYRFKVKQLLDVICYKPFALGVLRNPNRSYYAHQIYKELKITPFKSGNKLSSKFKKEFASCYIEIPEFEKSYEELKKYRDLKILDKKKIERNLRRFANKYIKDTKDLVIGVGYRNPNFYRGPLYYVGQERYLGVAIRRNISLIDFLCLSQNFMSFFTPMLFKGVEKGKEWNYPPNIYLMRRSKENAYIDKKARYFPLFFDIDVCEKKKGSLEKKVNKEKLEKAIKFINVLQKTLDNVFLRLSKSGKNFHLVVFVDVENIKNKTLYVKKLLNFVKNLSSIVKELPYDEKIYDYSRLIFNSPYAFVPIKLKKPEDALKFPQKLKKAIKLYLKSINKPKEYIAIEQEYIDLLYQTIFNETKSSEELEEKAKEFKKFIRKLEKKELKEIRKLIERSKRKQIVKLDEEKTKKIINTYINTILKYKEKKTFFYLVLKLFLDLGFKVKVYGNNTKQISEKSYLQVSISPDENTPFDIYIYFNDVRFFYLQSENSIRHIREEIVFAKIVKINGQVIYVPYKVFKEKREEYKNVKSIRFVIPNIFLDELIKDILENFYNVKMEVKVLKYIASRVSYRIYKFIQTIKEKLEKGQRRFDLKVLSKKERFDIGFTDLMKMLEALDPKETGIKVTYQSKKSFEIEVINEKGKLFLYLTLTYMQFPMLINQYLMALQENKMTFSREIYEFAYNVYRKSKIASVATSLGYRPKTIFKYLREYYKRYGVFEIRRYDDFRKLKEYEFSFEKMLLIFIMGEKFIGKEGCNKYCRLIYDLHKKVFGDNIFEICRLKNKEAA